MVKQILGVFGVKPPPVVLILLLILSWTVSICPEALAVTQYHCNGRIQFKPCKAGEVGFVGSTGSRAMPRRAGPGSAEVLKPSFARLSKTDGLWRGLLRGVGKVRLVLMVSNQGEVSSTYMGSIVLDKPDEKVSFRFISSVPKTPGWRWQIITES